MEKPNCYDCVHRLTIPGDAHSKCNNVSANVTADVRGVKMGWFRWPYNFDPTWLKSCNGFSNNPEDKKPLAKGNSFLELMALFGR